MCQGLRLTTYSENYHGRKTMNWRRAQDYQFTEKLEPRLWAWQFLRRNPEYIKDWHWFDKTWQALEAEYGSPPNRDYHRWKQDPRAYRLEREIDQTKVCATNNSSTSDNLLLIECWMGSKWGFYKFPINPQNNQPDIGTELSWRNTTTRVRIFTKENIDKLPQTVSMDKLVCVIDLQKSLKEQMIDLRQQLVMAKKNRVSHDNRQKLWCLCLRLLDAERENASESEILSVLFGQSTLANTSDAPQEKYAPTKELAHHLVYGGCRELIAYNAE